MLAPLYHARVSWLLDVETERQSRVLNILDSLPDHQQDTIIQAIKLIADSYTAKPEVVPEATPPPETVDEPLHPTANNEHTT